MSHGVIDRAPNLPPKDSSPFSGGFEALAAAARSLGIQVTVGQIVHRMGHGRRTPDAPDLLRAARLIGLKARLLRDPGFEKLRTVPVPALIKMNDGVWLSFKGEIGADQFRLFDPVTRAVEVVGRAALLEQFGGEVILLGKSWSHAIEDVAFGISWFLPAIRRYRRPLIEMLAISFFINLLAIGFPLSFQIVIDKVLSHRSYSTLVVVILGLVLLAAFSAILTYVRQYLVQHTASRIDVELGSKLFAHLLHLPVSYFETRAAGVIVTRARELRSIRNFLTGRALPTFIDLIFIFIYVAVLFLYSAKLTWVVLASLPFYALIGGLMRPALRRKLKAKFRSWASTQKLMVESIVGITTVKSAAVEPIFQRKWEDRIAASAITAFEAAMLGVTASTLVSFIAKVVTALILFMGTISVLDGELSVGGLIAFNLLAKRMVQPIQRVAQLWQDFQEFQVSVDHVADIFNEPTEPVRELDTLPAQLSGEIAIRNVTFSYKPNAPPTLKRVSLTVAAGEVIGIVGPSGSGKSTLTKLLQRFHTPGEGEILVDGVDIAQIDPTWLRRQLGVVLQENFLFNETVHDNIAIARPNMQRAQVVRAARLAGADEFIRNLPQGYDARIEERGANLSGGQRQRLAIARALATNPRILIFDEATSALDYESERIIQNNMDRIVEDRTVIIIAHRLAAVRNCNRIVGMVAGEIVETGTHDQLLRRRNGLYAHLWSLQNEHAGS